MTVGAATWKLNFSALCSAVGLRPVDRNEAAYQASATIEFPGSISGRRTLCAIVRTGKFQRGAEGFDKQGSLRTIICFLIHNAD
jgi:hypothetical protein